jgi:nucleoside-diphosphate-sugar epimerase
VNERVAVVTGGAGAIGGAIVHALRAAAAGIPRAGVLVHAAAAFDQATLAEVDLETWRRVQAPGER